MRSYPLGRDDAGAGISSTHCLRQRSVKPNEHIRLKAMYWPEQRSKTPLTNFAS